MSSSPHLPSSSSPHRKWRYVFVALVAVLATLYVWNPWASKVAVDFVSDLPKATEQRPEPGAFRAMDAIQNGAWKKSIYVTQPSRLVYRLDEVPRKSWLRVDFGVREEAWSRESPGVLFVLSIRRVADPDQVVTELVSMTINPFSNHADRQWHPIQVDLTPWVGQSVDVMFETRRPNEHANLQHHLALWGAPAIITK